MDLASSEIILLLQYFTPSNVDLFIFIYVYGCFACMYIYAPCVYLVLKGSEEDIGIL